VIYIPNHSAPIVSIYFIFRRSRFALPHCKTAVMELALRQFTQGTQRKSRHQFLDRLEYLGSELKPVYMHEALGIKGTMLTEHRQEILELWQEAIQLPLLSADHFADTQRIYSHELQNRYEEDEYLSYIWLLRLLYRTHPLWPSVSLSPKAIEDVTIDEVKDLWPSLFSQDTFVPCFSGDLSLTQAQQSALTFAQNLPHTAHPLAPHLNAYPILPLNEHLSVPLDHQSSSQTLSDTINAPFNVQQSIYEIPTHILVVHRSSRQQAQIYIAHRSIAASHPDALALEIAMTAIGGTFTSPLMQELRVKRGLTYASYATISFHADGSLINFNANVDQDDCAEALQLMLEIYARASRGDLSDTEISFAQNYIMHAYPLRIESSEQHMYELMRSRLIDRPKAHMIEYPDLIHHLSIESIRQAARTHLAKHPYIVIMGDRELIHRALQNYPSQIIHSIDAFDEVDVLIS
jgi:zinc protease